VKKEILASLMSSCLY